MIKLGSTVRDTISGFQGVAVERREHLAGRICYLVQPRGIVKPELIDVELLYVIQEDSVEIKSRKTVKG